LAFTTISGASASDATTFFGTDGVDNLTLVNASNYIVYSAQDDDTVTIAAALDGNTSGASVNGGAGDDALNLNVGILSNSSINGNTGDDVINTLQAINSTINGGQDTDTITIAGGSGFYTNGNKGTDTITLNTNNITAATVRGGQGGDVININAGANTVSGSVFYGDLGNDIIQTTGITGGWNNSTVYGGNGDDSILLAAGGTDEDLVVSGDDGNDTLTTGTGDDEILGGDGADNITGNGGDDTMTGGAGVNTFNQATNGDSTAYTATSRAGAYAAGDTITFGNGVDVITDFAAGATAGNANNVLNLGNAGLGTDLIANVNTTANLTINTNYFASGTYNTATGVFTIATAGTGPDTMYVWEDGTAGLLSANANTVILRGVVSTNLVAANIV